VEQNNAMPFTDPLHLLRISCFLLQSLALLRFNVSCFVKDGQQIFDSICHSSNAGDTCCFDFGCSKGTPRAGRTWPLKE
jgi:hypothetical protein